MAALQQCSTREGHNTFEILLFDYCVSSVTTLFPGIWMSFFVTEEVHAVMLDMVADEGGRAALKGRPLL